MENISQEDIASQEASSEYYEARAPGFVGFYPDNFGYDSYGEGDFISAGADDKVYALFENEETGKIDKYEFTAKWSGPINGVPQEEWEKDIAEMYCQDLFSEFVGKGIAVSANHPPVTRVEFEKVWSPREYNFRNDEIDIKLHVTSKEDFSAWARKYTENNEEDWDKLLKALFTRRDGFMPYYSNDPATWKEETENYTNLGGLGGRRGSETIAVSILLQFFLWRESKLWVNNLTPLELKEAKRQRVLKTTDWWDSFQGSFEEGLHEAICGPTECHGDTFDIKTNTVRIANDEAYILKVLKENHNTKSWRLLDEEEE